MSERIEFINYLRGKTLVLRTQDYSLLGNSHREKTAYTKDFYARKESILDKIVIVFSIFFASYRSR